MLFFQNMLKLAGFNLTREISQVPGGGLGVFLSAGKAERGSLVALYPGMCKKKIVFFSIMLVEMN